jgi:hypothetical protein
LSVEAGAEVANLLYYLLMGVAVGILPHPLLVEEVEVEILLCFLRMEVEALSQNFHRKEEVAD